MERKQRQRAKTVRALIVTGLRPMERLISWEIELVRDRIEAIVLGGDHAALPAEQVPDAR